MIVFDASALVSAALKLELALAAGAGIIVSGDEDLLVLNPWRGVQIIGPATYFALPA